MVIEWSARDAYFLPVRSYFPGVIYQNTRAGIAVEGIHLYVVYLCEGDGRSPGAHFPALDWYLYNFCLL